MNEEKVVAILILKIADGNLSSGKFVRDYGSLVRVGADVEYNDMESSIVNTVEELRQMDVIDCDDNWDTLVGQTTTITLK